MAPPRHMYGRHGLLAVLLVAAGASTVVAETLASDSAHLVGHPVASPSPAEESGMAVSDSVAVVRLDSVVAPSAVPDTIPALSRPDWLRASLPSFDLPPAGARHMLVPLEEQVPMWQQVSMLYVGQWGYYLASQSEALGQEGSFHNWYSNPATPHFDKDFYDYNLVRHTMAGSLYYGYYRAFGTTRQRALALSTVSVLLFEFSIEVATERPSWQDVYQTPVLGALLGMGLEDLSLACLRSPWMPVRVLGYMFNPFVLVPGSAWRLGPDPDAALRGRTGGRLVANF